MGREFASAAARWCHLLDLDFVPVIVAVCDKNEAARKWFTDNVASVALSTDSYETLLEDPDVEAVYCAVPHNLHEQIYIDILQSGKHLLGEKPFGIDIDANKAIIEEIERHPDLLVRCSSEFPFFPAVQNIVAAVAEEKFGTILDVSAGFLHSSDLDPTKPINWKRRNETNGLYGCMGDLGMHVLHLPLRFGWMPENVRAVLSNIVTERPDGHGGMTACETWDNAQIFTEVTASNQHFPMLLETKRIAPGETNTWYIRVVGTKFSAEFSTKYPKSLKTLSYTGSAQAWQTQDLGYRSCYPAITGAIFEFGFSDSILQMWAAFCDELVNGPNMRQSFYCATPVETMLSHRVLSAALKSNESKEVVHLSA
jgi:predicted dehydrogenase